MPDKHRHLLGPPTMAGNGFAITYIRLAGGFVYLVAIIDWYSHYVLA